MGPVATAGRGPVATAGRGPVATAGRGPVATAGRGPVATAGRGPVATAGRGPVAAAGLSRPQACRGRRPVAAAGLSRPQACRGRRPVAAGHGRGRRSRRGDYPRRWQGRPSRPDRWLTGAAGRAHDGPEPCFCASVLNGEAPSSWRGWGLRAGGSVAAGDLFAVRSSSSSARLRGRAGLLDREEEALAPPGRARRAGSSSSARPSRRTPAGGRGRARPAAAERLVDLDEPAVRQAPDDAGLHAVGQHLAVVLLQAQADAVGHVVRQRRQRPAGRCGRPRSSR